jgi:TonB family protein
MVQAYLARMFALIILLSAFFPAHAQTGEQQPAPLPSPSPAAMASSSSPGDSTEIIALQAPKPAYPMEAANKGVQGKVWIHLLISETGDVESADIISGDPDLARAAQEAMKKWKFKPYIRDGKPVKVSTKMPFDFAFKNRATDATAPPDSSANASASPAAAAGASGEGTSGERSDGNPPQRLPVSSGVAEGLKLHDVKPTYPLGTHIQGVVILQATIGKDGLVHNLKAISGHPILIGAAMDAVRQWRYRAYLLKGEPVEVETTVIVRFQR